MVRIVGVANYEVVVNRAECLVSMNRAERLMVAINGDGIDELMISSRMTTSTGPGQVYIIYGSKTWSATIDLRTGPETVLASKGLVFTDNIKRNPTDFGYALGNLGDINGDGKPDFGMSNMDTSTTTYIGGTIYVILDRNLIPGTTLKELDKAQFNGSNGFTVTDASLPGDISTYFGVSMNGIGDINKDGYDDFVITGSLTGLSDVGSAYVIFGQKNFTLGTFSVDQLNASGYPKGFRINGKNAGDFLGAHTSLGLDVSGDGINDLIIQATYADNVRGGTNAGEIYVIYGGATLSSTIQGGLFDLIKLNGMNGFIIVGNGDNYIMGEMGVYSLGDINKDGLMILG